jgi:hypothetical protein
VDIHDPELTVLLAGQLFRLSNSFLRIFGSNQH